MRREMAIRAGALALAAAMAVVSLAGCSQPMVNEGGETPGAEQGAADGAQGAEGNQQPAEQQPAAQAIPESAIISVDDLHSMLEAGEDVTVVDVRSRAGFTSMAISGSKNLPAGQQFELRLREVPADKPVVLIGSDASDLSPEYNVLLENGFGADSIRVVEGGVQAWSRAGYPTESNNEYAC